MSYTRRTFLKTLASTGAVVAGGLSVPPKRAGASVIVSENEREGASDWDAQRNSSGPPGQRNRTGRAPKPSSDVV